MKKSKSGAVGIGKPTMPAAVAAMPMKPRSAPKQGGAGRIGNLGDYAHPKKKKR